ncbi:MAG: HYR domain-containing protein, partial [Psychroserpens sp.]
MRKITCLIVLLILIVQTSFAQDKYSRIKIQHPDQRMANTMGSLGLDLECGAKHDHDDLILEVSELELNALKENNIAFTVLIDDMQKFYADRAKRDMPRAIAELEADKAMTANRASVSSVVLDNVIQYTGCDEIDWATPANFNLGSMAGCLTLSEMEAELDEMYTYSQTNGLDIVAQKADASSTGVTTWGNPSSTITNNGLTYSGQGTSRWDPNTVYYVRITGNQSTTPENSKPQMLFTSMIHSREVSALMNNIFFMWYIIENYNTDPAIQELVDNNELYFVPVVNPDGLRWNEHLSSSGGGLQRKNLRPNTGGTGNTSNNRGVDLNRNFDYFWGINNIGSSGTQTSSTYRGPSPESEPETQIMVDFIENRFIKSGVWNHSFANSIPHPYGGVPTQASNREDEYYRWHEEMSRYNRYVYGATIFYESNGLPDDWMMGGAPDNNGSTGFSQNVIATTPEHGSTGFWPSPSDIVPIAKRSMRISLGTAYYGGKYAKLHDLTQSNISGTTNVPLDFGIERIGQTQSDFTVTVTPISANITSVTNPGAESGIPINTTTNPTQRHQRTVTATIDLNPAIAANDKIEYNVTLANDDGVIYSVNYEKYYQPTLLFDHDPDASGLTGWSTSGTWAVENSSSNNGFDVYSGSGAISSGSYPNNTTKTLTTTNSYDFSNSTEVLIQFYTKWDIERNYDYVEVLGSPDGGSSWIPLCGNYTKPNATSDTTNHDNKGGASNFQANSDGQIYDGDRMDTWVMEEITIDNTYASLLSSNNVQIRFLFRTDGSNVDENYTTTNDGFFIDDFKIISVQIPCVTTVPTNVAVSNITTVTAQVDWDAIPSATYDLRYRETGSGAGGWITVSDIATNSYLIFGLTASTDYDVEVRTRCTTATSAYSTTETFTTDAVVPCTGSVIDTFPYSESFESGFGLWSQDGSDNFDWTRKIEEGDGNSTPSNNTGPALASDGQYFLFTEASNPNFPSRTANLLSPCIDFTGRENASFSYDYHMFGGFMGDLYLEVSLDDGASFTTIPAATLSGEQNTSHTDPWNTQVVDLSAYDGAVIKLRFRAVTSSDGTTGWQGDISIDNFGITSDEVTGSAPPNAVCQNITVQLDSAGNATIVATDVDGGSTDDVGITSYSIDIDTFDCSNIGTPVDVTLTVTDGDLQTDTCVAQVTVEDSIDPQFVGVPGNISLTCGNNQPTWTDPTATDNCDTTLTVVRTDGTGLNSGDTFPNGLTVISYSVTDDSGNTATASFNVTIVPDTTNPVAVCQNVTIQLDGSGNATITPSDINNGSSDNCGIASISASQTAFTCSDEGTNNVTLTVTDTSGNIDTCIAVVTVDLQDAPTGLECWETATYNYTTCAWEVSGTQPPAPTGLECWETATFNNTTCAWEVSGTQPPAPTGLECWETATFNNTTCAWEVSGTQPPAPTGLECWETATFNNTTCAWEVSGTQPPAPTGLECWETATFNNTTCAWEVSGTQPPAPTGLECWETATFNNTTCAWEVSGTQPPAPTGLECWETATFNNTTCAWEVSGTQPPAPTGLECWETATFNNTTCAWEVSGTQPPAPTGLECWETATFNNTTCAWEVSGTQPPAPTGLECWETATFNNTTCAWEVSGTQPPAPTGL